MPDRLRPLWDFDDLDTTETRLRVQLDQETGPAGRAEVLTQLARVHGLRGQFAAGERLLEEAEPLADGSAIARARIDLERSRLRSSGGNATAAFPLSVSSFAVAREAGELFVAADAAHMAALEAPDEESFLDWTERGIELVREAEPGDRYWLGPLLNNLGWHFYEAGEYERALDAFHRALAERELDSENSPGLELALYSVAKAHRALGRPDEGAPLLERAAASAESRSRPDGWIEEELAETYAALGRPKEARQCARRALSLLAEADPDFVRDEARSRRLYDLAGGDTD